MMPFIAIARHTCRSAVRSKVFRFLFFLLILSAFAVPATVKGDGTITGYLQVLLEYSTGIVGLILSTSAIWMMCSEFCTDLENGQIHLIAVKPVSRLTIWLGKFSGVFLIHFVLLAAASLVIYIFAEVSYFRMRDAEKAKIEFSAGQLERIRKGELRSYGEDFEKTMNDAAINLTKLDNELFTARRSFYPQIGNLDKLVASELERRVAQAKVMGETLPDMNGSARRNYILTLKRELLAKMGEVPKNGMKSWSFAGMPENYKGIVFVRYKIYMEELNSKDQRPATGAWRFRYVQKIYDENDKTKVKDVRETALVKAPEQILSSVYHEFPVSGEMICYDGTAEIAFLNLTNYPTGTSIVHFQVLESPRLLIKQASFTNNFIRMVFVTGLGIFALCAVAAFAASFLTMPVAVFISIAYILTGLFSKYIVTSIDDTASESMTAMDYIGQFTGNIMSYLLIPVQDFFTSGFLAAGELIEYSYMLNLVINNIILKGLPLCLLGILLYHMREFALAMRR